MECVSVSKIEMEILRYTKNITDEILERFLNILKGYVAEKMKTA